MPQKVAVLGAGVMGVSIAIFLARAGITVSLFDREHTVMSGASRWNEGKIHLGFLYAAAPNLRTAEAVLPGGLQFRTLLEDLIETSIKDVTTPYDDVYLAHPASIVNVDTMRRYFRAVGERVRGLPGYLAPIGEVRELSQCELDGIADPKITCGFAVPERSVDTIWIADHLSGAIAAEPRIRLLTGVTVTGISSLSGNWSGPWRVSCQPALEGSFDVVINALWEGRLAVDLSVGLVPQPGWTHRYRRSLFVETQHRQSIANAVLATGPFGDVKDYGNGRYYMSWYPSGLLVEGHDIEPPAIPNVSATSLIAAIRENLQTWLLQVKEVIDRATMITVGGGWVFAQGRGSLDDSTATIHRRDQFGIKRKGRYISVDTGKYSTAPWLARCLADSIISR